MRKVLVAPLAIAWLVAVAAPSAADERAGNPFSTDSTSTGPEPAGNRSPGTAAADAGRSRVARSRTLDIDFDDDLPGRLPAVRPGAGRQPSALGGDYATTLEVAPLFGDAGKSRAAGNVAVVDVQTPGGYRLLEADGALNGGVITTGTVRVGFDFAVPTGGERQGFAFLRTYDDNEESFADIRFDFDGDRYTVELLDYAPASGEFLGVKPLPRRADGFDAGTWHRFELVIDLDADTLRLRVDGVDQGVRAGISRATGRGYRGVLFDWGTAYAGRSAIDNLTVSVPPAAGLPEAPDGFAALLTPDDRGGAVRRIPGADFRRPGLSWRAETDAELEYAPVYDGVASYRLAVGEGLDEADARPEAVGVLPVKPNRAYEISALIRTDFPRGTWEVSVGAYGVRAGRDLLGARYGGLPAVTVGPDGWQRWTWRFVPHWPDVDAVRLFLGVHEYGPGFDGEVGVEIADLALVELPAEPLVPFAPGEGVSFRGGPGDLPMAVEAVRTRADRIEIDVTAATFRFDPAAGTLDVVQRIGFRRRLASLDGLPLGGLTVSRRSAESVVLVGDALSVGVQADGALVISPQRALRTGIESRIGGVFNRLAGGDLLSQDDFGGFTANVHVPPGSGRTARLVPTTDGLAFVGLPADDLDTPGAARAGWRAEARLAPGERLFVSAFPSRPYDWARSFDFFWSISDFDAPLEYDSPPYVSDWVLWNISQRGWAMSFGPRHEPRENVPYRDHIDAASAAGDRWSAYFSQWFYYSRDPEEWVSEVRRWRDEYGMSAVYSDGLAADDWLAAYEAMRMLRGEVFPGGSIIIHDSFPQSGAAAAAFRPFVYSYASATYLAENARTDAGADWSWARYASSQFRRGGSVGVTKGDGWEGFEGVEKDLVSLVWGGRGMPDTAGFEERYLPILRELEQLWMSHGDDPHFFDRYYHPRARQLTGYDIGRVGMPIVARTPLGRGERVALETLTPDAVIRYTLDGRMPNATSARYRAPVTVNAGAVLRARAFRPGLDPSAVARVDGGG